MSVQWETVHIPLAAGMDTRTDERALQPPALAVARDVQFDEIGGIQKRLPFVSGASGPEDIRRIYAFDNELVIFTGDSVYVYNAAGSELVHRGVYLAPKITERTRFSGPGEQPQCDRAELGGFTLYAWIETAATDTLYVAAIDTATGATVVPPTFVATSVSRPRLCALTGVVLLFYKDGIVLRVRNLDVSSRANLATSIGTAGTIVSATVGSYYDVAKKTPTTAVVATQDASTIALREVNESKTTVATGGSLSRAVNGPLAVAVAPNGMVAVVRCQTATTLQADLMTSALADSAVNVAVGSGAAAVQQVAAAFDLQPTGGAYRCRAFWNAVNGSSKQLETNYVDTAGSAGSESTLVYQATVCSSAFAYGSRVFFWAGFAESSSSTAATVQVQNRYFLYDDEGAIHATAVANVAAGVAVQGYLPSVQALSATEFAAALIERQTLPIDGSQGYSQRGPRDVIVTFDSDEARRVARLGETLYVSGGRILQWDGVNLVELGFAVAPYDISAADTGAGSIGDGTYYYQATLRWDNARGERDRSTSLVYFDASAAGGGSQITVNGHYVGQTSKATAALELWRTAVNPAVVDAPYYLATGIDPAVLTGSNRYIQNDRAGALFPSFVDDLSDANLTIREIHPESGGSLETTPPPAATIVAAGVDRLYLAGIAHEPHRVAYSKTRGAGEVAAFNDALYLDLPPTGGPVTALAFLNETLIAFKQSAVYAVPGLGFDNAGGGANFEPRLISSDVGASSADAVAVTADGIVAHSAKGWHIVDRSLTVRYIGAPVADFDSYEFSALHVVEGQHQLRCFGTTSGAARLLVLDTVAGQWAEWVLGSSTVHSAYHLGAHTIADADGLRVQAATHGTSGYTYGIDLETPWIKLADIAGFQRVRRLVITGEYRSAHRLRVRVAYDYDDSAWTEDNLWTVSPTVVGGPLVVEHRLSRQKCAAVKFRISDQHASTSGPPPGEGLKLTSLALEIGRKRGLRRLPAAQRL